MNLIPDFQAYMKLIDEKEKSESNLIFGKKNVPVSKIMQQLYYCEKQLELELIHGERMSDAKEKGKEGHEADIEFLHHVKIEKAWMEATRQNKRTPYNIRELPLLAKYQGILIEGRADEVSFLRGQVLTLSEFKFRKDKKVYDNDRIQPLLYGFFLNQMGFDTSNLTIEVICFDPKDRKHALLIRDVLNNTFGSISRSYSFNLDESQKELDRSLSFWKGERKAVPTSNPNKCKKCEFIEECHLSNSR